MAKHNDIGILITGILNVPQTVKGVNQNIKTIENMVSKIKLKTEIDPKILESLKFLNQQQNQIAKQAKGVTVINDAEALKSINSVNKGTKEIWTNVEQARKKYAELGQVKLTKTFDPVTKEVNGFNMQVTRANGLVDDLRYKLVALQTPNGLQRAFELTTSKTVDNTEKLREQQLEKVHSINKKIADQEQKVLDTQKQQTKELRHQVSAYKQNKLAEAERFQRQYGNQLDDKGKRQLDSYIQSLNRLDASMPQVQQKMRNMDQGFKNIKNSTDLATKSTISFGNAVQQAMLKFPLWVGISAMVFAPIRGIQDALRQIVEIDSQLTVLKRVSNGQEDINRAMAEGIDIADRLGNQLQNVMDSFGNYARQGFRGEDLYAMAEASTLFQNISELSAEEASSGITAILKGFQLLPTEANRVIDSINEVDKLLSLISVMI